MAFVFMKDWLSGPYLRCCGFAAFQTHRAKGQIRRSLIDAARHLISERHIGDEHDPAAGAFDRFDERLKIGPREPFRIGVPFLRVEFRQQKNRLAAGSCFAVFGLARTAT